MSRTLKIVVAEPSLIIRSGVLSVLRRLTILNAEITEAAEMKQLENLLGRYRPDALIVNPSLPGMFPLGRLKERVGCCGLRCVALQSGPVDSSALKGYDEVISVYDTAEQIKEKLLRLTDDAVATRAEQRDRLSTREKEIVVWVVKGLSNKQIAGKLFLSVHTVITHRRNIAAKLQIHSPAGLTIYAIVNKLVELNDIKESIRSKEE